MPVLIKCRRILRTSGGLVTTASTFMGEPQRLQRRASTSQTLASSSAQLHGVPWKAERDSRVETDGSALSSPAHDDCHRLGRAGGAAALLCRPACEEKARMNP